MTRVEEIQKAVSFCRVEEVPNGFAVIPQLSFVVGALWADAHPVVKVGGALKNYERGYEEAINKACNWLLEWETHQGEDIEVVKQFRKAMESSSSELPNNSKKGGKQ